jgi:hypothetical protein
MRTAERAVLMLLLLLAPSLGNAQKLTVTAVSHPRSERDYTITTTQPNRLESTDGTEANGERWSNGTRRQLR